MSILRAGTAPRLALGIFCACLAMPLQAGDHAAAAAPRPLVVHTGQRYSIPEGSPLRERISVAAVRDEALPDRIPVQAVVEADPGRSVTVLAPFTGRLQRLMVHLGERVSQGQPVAEISAPDLSQSLADLDKAQDAVALARKGRDRAEAVLAAGGNAAKDLELADSALTQAQAEHARARARLRALDIDPDQRPAEPVVRLRAPIAGVVTAVGGAAGGFITDPTVALLTISNLDQVWVSAQVPEPLLAAIHPGLAADLQFAAFPGEVLHGKVASLAATLDADTRRTRARIPLANPAGRFRPNMFATVTFMIPRGRTVRVPQAALMMINDSVTVLVEVAPWTFERQVVELGGEDAHGVRVLSGVQAGQRLIVRGGVLLND